MGLKSTKRCRCDLKKNMGQGCENCSRYKMVFLLKNSHCHLKVINKGGRICNPARWCFLKQNNRPITTVFEQMLKRFEKSELYHGSNIIVLYERGTDNALTKRL